jgi:branched-chain amino acid transport system substrate-binding protein
MRHVHAFVWLFIALVPCNARGEDKPTAPSDAELLIGMSTALSGPATQLGVNVKAGVSAAFAEVNEAGGIQGRRLQLIALDDGYEPARTVPNMHALIDEHRVMAIVGNVGTPTAVAAIPIANHAKTVLFGAYTGAGVLRKNPPDRYVVNFRASYAEETAAMVDALSQRSRPATGRVRILHAARRLW